MSTFPTHRSLTDDSVAYIVSRNGVVVVFRTSEDGPEYTLPTVSFDARYEPVKATFPTFPAGCEVPESLRIYHYAVYFLTEMQGIDIATVTESEWAHAQHVAKVRIVLEEHEVKLTYARRINLREDLLRPFETAVLVSERLLNEYTGVTLRPVAPVVLTATERLFAEAASQDVLARSASAARRTASVRHDDADRTARANDILIAQGNTMVDATATEWTAAWDQAGADARRCGTHDRTTVMNAIEAFCDLANNGQHPDGYSFVPDTPGRKYTRIVMVTGHGTGGRSVHCFVDNVTGDVFKAAGWKAPAKIIRGNIVTGFDAVAARWEWTGAWLYVR